MPKIGANKNVRLTKKQEKVVEMVVDIATGRSPKMNKKEILKKAGYKSSIYAKSQADIFSSEGIKYALLDAGLTPQKMASVLGEASQAKKSSWFQGQLYKSDEPDHDIRLKALDNVANLLGLKKQVIQQNNLNVNVDYSEVADLF